MPSTSLRVLGRWMRMVTNPQHTLAHLKRSVEFDDKRSDEALTVL